MTLTEARKQFPHTWTDMVYLNHAAVSPMTFRVRDAVHAYMEKRALTGIEPYPWALKILLETKQMLGQLINTDSHRIAMVLNTSDGLNVLANGIDWKPNDRILLSSFEFPSNVYPFLNLGRQGVTIDYLESTDGRITVDDIRNAITPETRLVTISSVQFLTGFKADLKAIGALCKERGIIFAVDAIQGLPHSVIDVKASHIDFLASGSHKWLMSPEGTGFIYVSEQLQSTLKQSWLGWTSVSEAFNFQDLDPNRLRHDAGRFENGTLNYLGVAGLNASLKFFFEYGIENIERATLEHSAYLIDRLSRHGIDIVTSALQSEHAGIVSIRMEGAQAIYDRLLSKNIHISVRAGRDGVPLLRIAPHFYNTEEELKKLLVELFD